MTNLNYLISSAIIILSTVYNHLCDIMLLKKLNVHSSQVMSSKINRILNT